MTRFLNLAIAGLAALIVTACSQNTSEPVATYYLVRHAEKVLDVKNPPLEAEGEIRALALKSIMNDVPLTAIYSTDYIRTQATVAPTATNKNLSITSYDPRDLEGFADKLLAETGHILVSGHSNTTPQLAEAMGAEPGEPIIEATEYNRLYIITRNGDAISGSITTYGD